MTFAAVSFKIISAKYPHASMLSADNCFDPAINGVNATIKFDNSTATSTNDKPNKLVIPLITSAAVSANIIADKKPTQANDSASIILDPVINGPKFIIN